MKQELLKGLTEEQIAKIKACNNSEKLLALAKEEGVELTDEQLSAISGGGLICSTEIIVLNVALDMMTLCSGVNVLQMGMKPFITNAKNVNVNGPRIDNLVRVTTYQKVFLVLFS